MSGLRFRYFLIIVLSCFVSLSVMGCSGSLAQQSQSVRQSPVSEQYKLKERLQGRTYIFLAETSTGQEQHRNAVSDSLAMALSGSDLEISEAELAAQKNRVDLAFLGFNGNIVDTSHVRNEGLEVFSFTDLTNKLNEKDLCQKHAEMKKFYQQNGMFRKSDLQFLASEIGADYIVLPCLLDVKRWSKGRFSVGGVRFLQTHVVSGMLGLEIWDTRTGRKVFSATSDITLATEKVKEEPMPIEEAFMRAWYGIMKELPGAIIEEPAPPVNVAGIDEAPDLPEEDNQPEQPVVASGEVAKADG
jgi:hypothetical protein